jgi:hypothetical protein
MRKQTLQKILYDGISKVKDNQNVNLVVDEMAEEILSTEKTCHKKHVGDIISFVLETPLKYLKSFYKLIFSDFIKNKKSWTEKKISEKQFLSKLIKTFLKICAYFIIISLLVSFSLESFSPTFSIITLVIFLSFISQKHLQK